MYTIAKTVEEFDRAVLSGNGNIIMFTDLSADTLVEDCVLDLTDLYTYEYAFKCRFKGNTIKVILAKISKFDTMKMTERGLTIHTDKFRPWDSDYLRVIDRFSCLDTVTFHVPTEIEKDF